MLYRFSQSDRRPQEDCFGLVDLQIFSPRIYFGSNFRLKKSRRWQKVEGALANQAVLLPSTAKKGGRRSGGLIHGEVA